MLTSIRQTVTRLLTFCMLTAVCAVAAYAAFLSLSQVLVARNSRLQSEAGALLGFYCLPATVLLSPLHLLLQQAVLRTRRGENQGDVLPLLCFSAILVTVPLAVLTCQPWALDIPRESWLRLFALVLCYGSVFGILFQILWWREYAGQALQVPTTSLERARPAGNWFRENRSTLLRLGGLLFVIIFSGWFLYELRWVPRHLTPFVIPLLKGVPVAAALGLILWVCIRLIRKFPRPVLFVCLGFSTLAFVGGIALYLWVSPAIGQSSDGPGGIIVLLIALAQVGLNLAGALVGGATIAAIQSFEQKSRRPWRIPALILSSGNGFLAVHTLWRVFA